MEAFLVVVAISTVLPVLLVTLLYAVEPLGRKRLPKQAA